MLEPGLPQEKFDPFPVGPLEVFIFPALKKPTVHGQDVGQIERVMHGSQFFEVRQLVRYLDVQVAGRRLSKDLTDKAIDQFRK